MIEITAALSSARAAIGLAKMAIDARDDAKLKAALAELQERVYDATSAALAMAEKATALQAALSTAQREKADLQAAIDDRARYHLQELRPGAFAYGCSTPGNGIDEAAHHLCQPCYDKGVKAVLRYEAGSEWTMGKWLCPEQPRHNIEDTQRTRP